MQHDGNGWVHCGQGHRHWGRFGAAGLLLQWPPRADEQREPLILLQHRAIWTADGGTWGIPGGARDSHETPVQTALREAYEETGIAARSVAVIDEFLDDHGAGWSYTTVLATAREEVQLIPQEESEELRWVAVSVVEELGLHPGFAGTWPRLRNQLPQARADGA